MQYQPNEQFMRRAIELSELAGIKEKTGGVFGAVIVKDNKIIAEGYNQVIKQCDPTWHGEIQAIRTACKQLRTPHLEGCILYTSAEPCPMCYAASCWAHIAHIFYGATVEDAAKYGNFDDNDFYRQLSLPASERAIKLSSFMRDDAVNIWKEFAKLPDHAVY